MRISLFQYAVGITLTTLSVLPAAPSRSQGGSSPTAFYVATNGNDSWSGKLAAPNAAHTDGPFATVERAQTAVRPLLGQPEGKPVSVVLRGGFYSLAKPVTFSKSDSGTVTRPVVWSAYPGETPVFSGGSRVTGWKRTGANRWEVMLPEVAQGKWYFSQLYFNGQRRLRPRLPKAGFLTIGGDYPPTEESKGKGNDRFRYRVGDIDPNWHNRDDVEILPFHLWSMSRFQIAAIDPAQRILTVAGHTRNPGTNYNLPHGNRYIVENVQEALSEPGQWYLDRKSGVLTYLAKPGEDPNRDAVIAPRIKRLLDMQGVENVVLCGITFSHAAWNIGPGGVTTGQAEIGIPPALLLFGCRNCALEGCTVTNIGNYAVQIAKGSQNCRIDGCTLRDLGAGGVLLGEQSNPADDSAVVSHNSVRNCLIAEGGRIHSSAVGIWVGQASNNTIEHNEIVDFYYSGISAGWTWGYAKNTCHDNAFLWNHIYKLGQGVLSDMGGIYLIGVMPGTVVDHNWIHDVQGYDYGGWGIYFDEGSTGISATNNVVYNTKSAPFHQHYGTNNRVENNIFALGGEAQLMRARGDNNKSTHPPGQPDMHAESSFTIRRNIIYYRDSPLLGNDWQGTNFTLADNIYWDADTDLPPTFPGGINLSQWQSQGHDTGSLVADPRFAAPERGDFTLAADSPALKIGFQPIDIHTAGRLPGATPYKPEAPRTYPPPPNPREYVSDDFEDSVVGLRQGGALAVVSEEGDPPPGSIRISNEMAATGKQSLKFTDAAGQKNAWNPNVYYKLKLTQGSVTGRFALRLEPGAVVTHEWSDGETPAHKGPSLKISADGMLVANGKPLGRLPESQWITVTITSSLGRAANGHYDLTIQPQGRGQSLVYKNLTCDADFRSLRRWGFISDTDGPSVFWLDDLSLISR